MKQVKATEILGNPNRIDEQVACPHCSARAMAFEDGSVMCIAENKCFSPEAGDRELFERRKAYDAANGITLSHRLNATMLIHQGALSDRATGNHG
ncbi:MAG: hypothetical protein WCT03_26865 [Candidatus Obscuribacterales bacterium]|jgi:hypothetical protein